MAVNVLGRVAVVLVGEHDVAVPLPDAVLRPVLVAEPDADVVVPDGDGLAGVGL